MAPAPRQPLSIVAFVVSLVVAACHPEPLQIRSSGSATREQLSLDELWEEPLETWGGRGPYAPAEATVSCSPIDRCRAAVVGPAHDDERPAKRLQVIGLRPGPVDVMLRYRQPDFDDWLSALVRLEFLAASPVPTLELDTDKPAGPFLFDHVSPALIADGIKGPARCTLENEFDEAYACFGAERVLGESRFPSCAHTTRCGTQIESGYFQIQLLRRPTNGRVFRVHMKAIKATSPEEYGVWPSAEGG